MVLAQVLEDRGPIGVRGRRLYRIRLDFGGEEPTTLEMPEKDLGAATEADQLAWRTKGTVAIHQTIKYFGREEDERGRPKPWYHYLIVAKPGPRAGSGTASILSLSQAREQGAAQAPSREIVVPAGGAEAALAKAEEDLDSRHPGLNKTIGERRG